MKLVQRLVRELAFEKVDLLDQRKVGKMVLKMGLKLAYLYLEQKMVMSEMRIISKDMTTVKQRRSMRVYQL